MTPDEFIARWEAVELTERAAAQSHFNDLCALLGEETPAAADPAGEWYAFEKGATKATGGQGWADVWKRGCFAWEYKSKGRDLKAALVQLLRYAGALENPPLLIVSDLARFEIHTNWTNTVSQTHAIALDELRDARKLRLLKWAFAEPERLKPGLTRQSLTEEVAAEFARLAQRLRARSHPADTVAHFINRLVFCMFAEDVGLLPDRMFGKMLDLAARTPEAFEHHAALLFAAMRKGGFVGFERVAWFNGGLFDDDTALPMTREDIALVRAAAARDWAEIDPSLFGTLFERGLDPDKRSQLGAHYTDRDKIGLIVEPVITRPWLAEWDRTKAEIAAALQRAQNARTPAARTRATNDAVTAYRAFLDRLRAFRVLDPACGSGNFLYLALLALKDIEHRAAVEAEAQGLPRELPQVGPQAVRGIEINPYAAELARVTVWIGEIQWMLRNGFGAGRDPILKPLETIECRDAILAADGGEAAWPAADVVIGNPPFLGGKLLRTVLGDAYVDRLFAAYSGRVPAEADLVVYWFAKAWERMSGGNRTGSDASLSAPGAAAPSLSAERGRRDGFISPSVIPAKAGTHSSAVRNFQAVATPGSPSSARIAEERTPAFAGVTGKEAMPSPAPSLSALEGGEGKVKRAGLVATNSIRGGASRRVLDEIARAGTIFDAWDDEPWVLDGAAVRVSLVCFAGAGMENGARLDGVSVARINPDLTGAGIDLTQARRLAQNRGVAFMGDTKGGAFDIPGDLAREWLLLPLNPNGRPNSDVLRPWMNGMDVTRNPSGRWIIDFGWTMSERDAALYEAPFEFALKHIRPERIERQDRGYAKAWWRHERPRPEMWHALNSLKRFIVTPEVSRYRIFAWLQPPIVPDHKLQVIASENETTFGILTSEIHKVWSLRLGSWHGAGNDPRYTIGTTFETFPEGLTPDRAAAEYAGDLRAVAIAAAAQRLDDLRRAWLNPPDLVERVPEVVAGYPDRIVPVDARAAAILKARTLTHLYNARPAWLAEAHRDLDAAVAAAYGWPADIAEEEALARLLALNRARAAPDR